LESGIKNHTSTDPLLKPPTLRGKSCSRGKSNKQYVLEGKNLTLEGMTNSIRDFKGEIPKKMIKGSRLSRELKRIGIK